jgi:hypothetical protein
MSKNTRLLQYFTEIYLLDEALWELEAVLDRNYPLGPLYSHISGDSKFVAYLQGQDLIPRDGAHEHLPPLYIYNITWILHVHMSSMLTTTLREPSPAAPLTVSIRRLQVSWPSSQKTRMPSIPAST